MRPKNDDGREAALRRLNEYFLSRSGDADDQRTLTEALDGQPSISAKLRTAPGGLKRVLAALRSYDDEDASAFVAVHESRSRHDLRRLQWEELAVAAGLTTTRLFEVSSGALLEYEEDVRKLMIASGVTKVTRRSLELAMEPKMIDDRMAMLKAGGVIPIPKGSQVAIQINRNELAAVSETPTTWDQESQIRKLHEAWGENTKKLPAASHELPSVVQEIQDTAVEALDNVF